MNLEITARVEVEVTSTAKHNEGAATSPVGGGGAVSKLRCCSGLASNARIGDRARRWSNVLNLNFLY